MDKEIVSYINMYVCVYIYIGVYIHIYIHNEISFSCLKNEILPLDKWQTLKVLRKIEISHTKTDILWSPVYVESQN